MRPYAASCYGLTLRSFVIFAAISLAATSAPTPTRYNNDANTRKGFDYFNNLEYEKAIKEFQAALKAHPDDPYAVNHLLAGVIFKELYRIGALDTEAYAADNFLTKKPVQARNRDTKHACSFGFGIIIVRYSFRKSHIRSWRINC